MHNKEYPLESYGHFRKVPYDPARCAEEVATSGLRFPTYHQCNNKPKDGIFCKVHSREGHKDWLWLVTYRHGGLKVSKQGATERKKTWKVDPYGQVLEKTDTGIMTTLRFGGYGYEYYGKDRDAILIRIRENLSGKIEVASDDLRAFVRDQSELDEA